MDKSVSGPVTRPGSVSGFCFDLCSLCLTALEIFSYLKLEGSLFNVNFCGTSQTQTGRGGAQRKRCPWGNFTRVRFLLCLVEAAWRSRFLGVCFAWPLSISGVSCGLSQSAPFYYCPLCRESTTLASLDGRVFLCVTDPLQEGCSACPPGVASSPGRPPGPGASVGFPTSSNSLQGNRGKPVVIFLSLSPTYSLRRRNSSKSEARTCYLSVVSGADAGFLRCIPVFLAVGIWRVRGCVQNAVLRCLFLLS